MKKYRPKEHTVYLYGTEHKACIACYPQSRWDLLSVSGSEVALSNKHTIINLSVEDFVKHWKVIEEVDQ